MPYIFEWIKGIVEGIGCLELGKFLGIVSNLGEEGRVQSKSRFIFSVYKIREVNIFL